MERSTIDRDTAADRAGVFCACGSLVLADVRDDTIVDVTNNEVEFKRRTDYVMCPACLNTYPVQRIREVVQTTDEPAVVLAPDVAA